MLGWRAASEENEGLLASAGTSVRGSRSGPVDLMKSAKSRVESVCTVASLAMNPARVLLLLRTVGLFTELLVLSVAALPDRPRMLLLFSGDPADTPRRDGDLPPDSTPVRFLRILDKSSFEPFILARAE